jgi:membrane peptidoglycan carboxypeptidase
MEQVVERGTATSAQVPGFGVAGKTGTATKWSDGQYLSSEHNASFVGFVPSRTPVYTILVVIDSPHGPNGYYGGPVSGPVFTRIAEAALRYAGVPRTFGAPPPLVVERSPEGVRHHPVSGPAGPPAIVPAGAAAGDPDGVVPDMTGLSARDALGALSRLRLGARVFGDGLVIEQTPAAGSPRDATTRVTLWLDRRRPAVRRVRSTDAPVTP